MIGRFFNWWGGELAALLPQSLRHASERRLNTLWLGITATEISARYGKNGGKKQLGSVPRVATELGRSGDAYRQAHEALSLITSGYNRNKTRVVVEVDPELALIKDVELPLAAEENLGEVLSFEMERQTPFHASEVYFDHRLLGRDTKSQKISVRLSVAPRRLVDEALALIEDWDLKLAPENIDVDPAEDRLNLSFLPAGFRRGNVTRLNAGLALVNCVLLVAAVAIPLTQQRAHLDQLRPELDKAKAAAGAATEMQERLDGLVAEIKFVSDEKRKSAAAVEMLEELTLLLPDSTWLHRLEVKDGRANLQGTSDGASSLIARIEASEMFREVRFGSPVTQDPSTGKERFQLSAQIVPRPREP